MSINEMMRLQGILPDDIKVAVSDVELGKQIGNAMSVNVVERLLPYVLRQQIYCMAKTIAIDGRMDQP